MSKFNYDKKPLIRRVLPYILTGVAIIGLVFLGSVNKSELAQTSINMTTMAKNNYQMTTDQISEMYVVANVASANNLASTEAVSNNYVISSVMRESGQGNAQRIDKPNIVNTSNISRGVIHYTVVEGDTVQSIAQSLGITNLQIRWSNGLRSDDITPGQNLVLPSVPGIVYTVKGGDDINGLVAKYGANKADLLSYNGLEEGDTLTEGTQIVLPGGALPYNERPENSNQRSSSAAHAATYAYTYFGSTSGRENMHTVYESVWTDPGNRMTPGQCVWYAWWWRKHSPLSLGALPDGMMGNASSWASILAGYGYRVDHLPQVGAVFQTGGGYYGHVGVVIGINFDGSITVREMNYGRPFVITEGIIPANQVGNFAYIH